MKNLFILNIMILFLSMIVVNNIDAQVQSSEPNQSHGTDCKTDEVGTVVDILPAPPFIDPDNDPDGDPDEEEENPEEETGYTRTVFFVHGYQGNKASWSNQHNFLTNIPNRKHTSLNEDYQTSSINTLDEIAAQIVSTYELDEYNDSDKKGKEKNFFIAHSMGGMALRFMQNKYNGKEKPYGGIITFGTGHKGVYAAETKIHNNKKYKDFLIEACQVHLEPLIHDILPVFAHTLNSITNILPLQELSNSVCETSVTLASEFLLDEVIDKNLTISALTSGPNAYPNEFDVKHKLALYGVEEDEMEVTIDNTTHTVSDLILPKFMGSYLNQASSYPLWGAGASDEEGLRFWNDAILNYTNKRDELNDIISNFWWRLGHHALVSYAVDKRNALDRSLIWMRDANFQYLELIGGIQDVNVQEGMCTCLNFDIIDGTPTMFTVPNPGSCASLIGQEINGYYIENAYDALYIQARFFENDGFILAESARAMPNPSRQPIRMQGSGHFQMRNDSNTELEFDNMFKNNVYGEYWKLYNE
jgi:hypothetical protein